MSAQPVGVRLARMEVLQRALERADAQPELRWA